jgi:two-component sensor histidine kinase
MGSLAADYSRSNAELIAHLHEKDSELQELREKYDRLCRRFRDNLGTLSTLFAAQARRTTQPELCRKCISCLLGAHDLQDVGDEIVSMAAYLHALSRALLTGFDGRVRLATSVDPAVMLEFRRAHCIGLIYAEAVSNALEHAFPGLSSGAVYATLRGDGRWLELTVVDSGFGFDLETAAQRGCDGLNFMRELAQQIDGDLRIRSAHTGTTVSLVCPEKVVESVNALSDRTESSDR